MRAWSNVHSELARFGERCVALSLKAVGNGSVPSVRNGDGAYADWVIGVLNGLRGYLDHTYRQLVDVLHERPGIVENLGLSASDLPDFTMVCSRKQVLEMRSWWVLFRLSASLHEPGEVQAMDSMSIAQCLSSYNYVNRVEDTYESVKLTALVDCASGAVLDIHSSMNHLHDTQIARQVLTGNLDRPNTMVADNGLDRDDHRKKFREEGIRPVIKHREFYSLDVAHNARIDDETYH